MDESFADLNDENLNAGDAFVSSLFETDDVTPELDLMSNSFENADMEETSW